MQCFRVVLKVVQHISQLRVGLNFVYWGLLEIAAVMSISVLLLRGPKVQPPDAALGLIQDLIALVQWVRAIDPMQAHFEHFLGLFHLGPDLVAISLQNLLEIA